MGGAGVTPLDPPLLLIYSRYTEHAVSRPPWKHVPSRSLKVQCERVTADEAVFCPVACFSENTLVNYVVLE